MGNKPVITQVQSYDILVINTHPRLQLWIQVITRVLYSSWVITINLITRRNILSCLHSIILVKMLIIVFSILVYQIDIGRVFKISVWYHIYCIGTCGTIIILRDLVIVCELIKISPH